MCSDTAIRVHNLGKRFELGELGTASDFVRKSKSLARRLLRTARHARDPSRADRPWDHEPDPTAFWALKGIDFEVKEGEVLGIIGANGAGKSTLLKVLSRITAPTHGHIELYGRVASLLEVGTGFHPELTGRENVFLNGSILGMTRGEIKAKLDEIVDFAGVEKFIDTPVKRYSSGMRVRLGFAVAAHLEPEILIVDEVLAVGDVAFQRKCLGKMHSVATSGRTVLFVSHNMSMVESLCQKVMVVDSGELVFQGDTEEAIAAYFSIQGHNLDEDGGVFFDESFGDINIGLLEHIQGVPRCSAASQPLSFWIELSNPIRPMNLRVGVGINDELGRRVTTIHTDHSLQNDNYIEGPARIECKLMSPRLAPGKYSIKVAIGEANEDYWQRDPAFTFEIAPSDVYGNGRLPNERQGPALAQASWHFQPTTNVLV